MSNPQDNSSSLVSQPQVAHYRPDVFLVQDQQQAREIILTPEFGMTTDERWEFETGYLAPEIVKFLEPSQESLILDFGCGLGRLSKAILGQAPCRILGVDISVSMRQLAPGYVVDENFSVVSHQVFVAMVAHGLRVNAAIALWVLQHCPQVDREVALIHQALSSGGRFYVLNNKHSAIPTDIGWVSDGTDLLTILREQFQTLKVGTLPPGVTHQEISRHSFIAELRKEAEK